MEVAVILAAYNASGTIVRAVRSALAHSEVTEVIVVDDASEDGTAEVARSADDGTNRLKVIRLTENCGPSAARNQALAQASAPYVTILDSDDFFLPGRFASMPSNTDWDIMADNIAFVPTTRLGFSDTVEIPDYTPAVVWLDLEAFVQGNIAKPGVKRGELGFLKPVIRRRFLTENDLRYDVSLRLGEDYDLYCRALVKGARFGVAGSCGYIAIERPESLSGRHKTEDLARLVELDGRFISNEVLTEAQRKVIVRHRDFVAKKHGVRKFLDEKSARGMSGGLTYLTENIRFAADISYEVISAKLLSLAPRRSDDTAPVRYLMTAEFGVQPRQKPFELKKFLNTLCGESN